MLFKLVLIRQKYSGDFALTFESILLLTDVSVVVFFLPFGFVVPDLEVLSREAFLLLPGIVTAEIEVDFLLFSLNFMRFGGI